jgi:secondary thiamine-phosphate synthase enzyme
MRLRFDTSTNEQLLDITSDVQAALDTLQALEGILYLSCRHTTAGLLINEAYDPDVARDLLMALRRIVPDDLPYRHAEGNSPAHLKAVLVGSSVAVPVSSGTLSLGRWQGIFLCEFDGPRQGRTIELTCTIDKLWISSWQSPPFML